MTGVERNTSDFVIDAALLGEAFGLPQSEIKARMRDGSITSRCETGVDKDAGSWRLTFHHAGRACRFVVDEAGNILTRATFPIKTRPQDLAAQVGATGTASSGTGNPRRIPRS